MLELNGGHSTLELKLSESSTEEDMSSLLTTMTSESTNTLSLDNGLARTPRESNGTTEAQEPSETMVSSAWLFNLTTTFTEDTSYGSTATITLLRAGTLTRDGTAMPDNQSDPEESSKLDQECLVPELSLSKNTLEETNTELEW